MRLKRNKILIFFIIFFTYTNLTESALIDFVQLPTTTHNETISGTAEGSPGNTRDGNFDTYYGAYSHHGGDGSTSCSITSEHIWPNATHIVQIRVKMYARPYPHGNYEHQKYTFEIWLRINGSWTSIYYDHGDYHASTPGWPGHEWRDITKSDGWDNVTGIKCYAYAWAYSYEGDRQQETWARVYEVQAFGYPPPTVASSGATNIQSFQATLIGNIIDTGWSSCDERGFEWGTSPGNYSYSWTETGSFGTGTFTYTLTGLNYNTTYYFRAKAHNPSGWGYGEELSFTTSYLDIGLRLFDGTGIIKVACEPAGPSTSPLRIAKNGTIYSIVLVDVTDPLASKIRIQTSAGIKAIRKLEK